MVCCIKCGAEGPVQEFFSYSPAPYVTEFRCRKCAERYGESQQLVYAPPPANGCEFREEAVTCGKPVQQQAAPSTVTPSYYITGTYEPRKVIQAWGLGWALGNAVAYIARAGKKPGNSAADDISKAANDLLMELDYMGVDVRTLCEEMVGRIEEGKKW